MKIIDVLLNFIQFYPILSNFIEYVMFNICNFTATTYHFLNGESKNHGQFTCKFYW